MKNQNVTKKEITYFLYARKSSESDDRQVQSIDDQIDRLKKLANARRLKIKKVLTESKSAKKPYNRPVFTDMMDRIKKGEASGILCWQFNRLSRNSIDSGEIQWMLQEGVIQSIQTPEKEYLPDDNVLLISVESGMANQFIRDLKKNSIRGMEGKAERGWLPSRAPAGYNNDLLEHIIVKDPERFHLVRKMWDMMLTGNYTPTQIRNIASDEWGFRTAKHKRDGGKEITDSMMYKVFTNIFYTGMFDWSGQRYQGKHDPMISMEEFDRVQALLGRDGRPRAKTKHSFAYTVMFRCGECGSMHTAIEKEKIIKATKKLKTYIYYYCTRKKKRLIKCTQKKTLEVGDLEIQIMKDIVKSNILPEFQRWAIEILNKSNDNEISERTKVYEMLHSSYAATQREIDSLTQMRYRELIDDETFLKEKTVLATKRDQLETKLRGTEDRAKKWLELTEKTFNFVTYSLKAFNDPKTDLNKKREILAGLGKNFIITDKKLMIEANDWLVPIIEQYPPLKAEYERLELGEYGSPETRKDAFASVRVGWGAYPVMNHTRETVERFLDRYLEIALMQCGLGLVDTTPLSSPSLPPPPPFDPPPP